MNRKKLNCLFSSQFLHFLSKSSPEKNQFAIFHAFFIIFQEFFFTGHFRKLPEKKCFPFFFVQKTAQNEIILPFFRAIFSFFLKKLPGKKFYLLFTSGKLPGKNFLPLFRSKNRSEWNYFVIFSCNIFKFSQKITRKKIISPLFDVIFSSPLEKFPERNFFTVYCLKNTRKKSFLISE